MSTLPVRDSSGVIHSMVMCDTDEGKFPKHLATTAADRFFATFSEFDTTNDWELTQVGSGMTYGCPEGGAAAGASPYLRISSGITANSKTILKSRAIFKAPIEVRFAVSASQRIANNTLRVGFLECDADGNLVTMTSLTTCPELLNARNGAMIDFNSTTVTTASVECRQGGGGIDSISQAFTGFTTVATGTSPNFIVSNFMSLSIERDRVTARNFVGNGGGTNAGVQVARDMNIPSAEKYYRLVIIVENGSTAPASTTDWRIHFVNLLDATRFDVGARHGGLSDAGRGFPVNVLNTPNVSISNTPNVNATITPATPTAFVLADCAATTNATSVKTTAGSLFAIEVTNLSAATRYVKFYNKASAPTVGTDIPIMTIPVPAGSFLSVPIGAFGIRFSTGIAFAITTAAGNADTGACAAGDAKLALTYL